MSFSGSAREAQVARAYVGALADHDMSNVNFKKKTGEFNTFYVWHPDTLFALTGPDIDFLRDRDIIKEVVVVIPESFEASHTSMFVQGMRNLARYDEQLTGVTIKNMLPILKVITSAAMESIFKNFRVAVLTREDW